MVNIKSQTDDFRAVVAHSLGKIVVEMAKVRIESRPEAIDMYFNYKVELPDGISVTIEVKGTDILLKPGLNEANYVLEGD